MPFKYLAIRLSYPITTFGSRLLQSQFLPLDDIEEFRNVWPTCEKCWTVIPAAWKKCFWSPLSWNHYALLLLTKSSYQGAGDPVLLLLLEQVCTHPSMHACLPASQPVHLLTAYICLSVHCTTIVHPWLPFISHYDYLHIINGKIRSQSSTAKSTLV